MKSITFFNYLVIPLGNWLMEQPLKGKDSRARTQFVALLEPISKQLEAHRMELVEKYGTKGKDGKFLMETREDGSQHFQMKDWPSFNNEYQAMMCEHSTVDILPSNREAVDTVWKLLQDTDYEFRNEPGGVPLATYYDLWCQAFEAGLKKR